MASDFIPGKEGELVGWSTNFSERINATPADYGLTPAQATAYSNRHDAFILAWETCNNPATRSPTNLIAKREARALLIAEARALARIVNATPGMDNQRRSELGLTIRKNEPSSHPAPDFAPILDIIRVNGRSVVTRAHDGSSNRRGRPAGVEAVAVFSFVGPTPPESLSEWTFQGNSSRTTVEINFPTTVPAGATVWLTAYWLNGKMQKGPASSPISTNLPGGSVTMAA